MLVFEIRRREIAWDGPTGWRGREWVVDGVRMARLWAGILEGMAGMAGKVVSRAGPVRPGRSGIPIRGLFVAIELEFWDKLLHNLDFELIEDS